MTISAAPASAEYTDVSPGFAVVRPHRNGSIQRDYLRNFSIVGLNGLANLGYGSQTAACLFTSRTEAEDIARRLRRRAAIGDYEYGVEEITLGAKAPSAP
jgi:hypothetical protein